MDRNRPDSASSGSRSASQAPPKPKDDDGWEVVPKKGKGGGGGGDGWSQASIRADEIPVFVVMEIHLGMVPVG